MQKIIKNKEQLIQLLIKRRKELGISQLKLAKLCNLSVNGISKLESHVGEREVKISTLFKLGQVLGFKIIMEFEE